MENETMIKRRVDRVCVKGERGAIPPIGIILIIVVVAIMVALVFFAWAPCADCSDVKKSGWGDYPSYEIEGKEEHLSIYKTAYAVGGIPTQIYANIAWMGTDGQTHDYQVEGSDFADALDKLDDVVGSLHLLSDEQKKDAHHIIDCIQRGCT